MPDLTENTIVSVNIDGRLDGQQILFTSHWRLRSDAWPGDPEMIATFDAMHNLFDAVDNLFAAYGGCLSEDVTNINSKFQAIHPIRYVYQTYSFQGGVGLEAEPALPPNVAHVITVRADDTGPGNRGNKHIGGVPTTFSEAGLVTAGGLVAYSGLGSWLQTVQGIEVGPFTNIELEPVIYHRAAPSLSPKITSHVIGTTTRVERRRTVGLGS